MDCSSPGPSVHRILQARLLEWVAIPFSRGSSRPWDWTCVSCIAGRCFTAWVIREDRWLIPYLKTLLNSPWSCRDSSQREESSLLVSFPNFTHFPPVRRGSLHEPSFDFQVLSISEHSWDFITLKSSCVTQIGLRVVVLSVPPQNVFIFLGHTSKKNDMRLCPFPGSAAVGDVFLSLTLSQFRDILLK